MTPTDAELGAELGVLFAENDLPESCADGLLAYIGGTASRAERARVMAHATGCPTCQETLGLVDPEPLMPPIRRSRRGYVIGALALAAAASVAIIVAAPTPDPPPVELTAKGSWRLHVGVERGGQRFRLTDRKPLAAGDRIGLFYDAVRPGFAAVFFVDDTGGITPLVPAEGGAARPVVAGQSVALPGGAELGEATGCEFVIGLYSPRPLPMAEARSIVAHMRTGATGCRLGDAPGGAAVQVDVRPVRR